MKATFICQLPKKEQLEIYRKIKRILIAEDAYSYENIKEAMSNKLSDILDMIG